jgi:hypothetical protein
MAEDLMGYENLAREALRGVVREAIRHAADEGLPGSHHFYISFRTDMDGVDIDPGLLKAHPQEMTIVLEHQFWDLAVDDDAFEVTLKFNRIPKYLRVPFEAVTQFHDPSVGFTLRFETNEISSGAIQREPEQAEESETPRPAEKTAVAAGDDAGRVVSLDAFRKKSD